MLLQLRCDPPAIPPSILTRAEAAWERHEEDLKYVVDALAPDEDFDDYFRSETDGFAAKFAPELLPHIQRFYRDEGPSLIDLFSHRVIGRIDRRILAQMKRSLVVLDFSDSLGTEEPFEYEETFRETFEALLVAELDLPKSSGTVPL